MPSPAPRHHLQSPYFLFHLKHAMSLTAASHGEWAAEIIVWEAMGASVTDKLYCYAASWAHRGGRGAMCTPAEGKWLKFTASFMIQTQRAKTLSKTHKTDEIYTELGWQWAKVLACSHTARCIFCCVVSWTVYRTPVLTYIHFSEQFYLI